MGRGMSGKKKARADCIMCGQNRSLRQTDGCFGPHNDTHNGHCLGSYFSPTDEPFKVLAGHAIKLQAAVDHSFAYPASSSPREGYVRGLALRAHAFAQQSAARRHRMISDAADVNVAPCGCIRFWEGKNDGPLAIPCGGHSPDFSNRPDFVVLTRPEAVPLVTRSSAPPPPEPVQQRSAPDPAKAEREFSRRYKENGGFTNPSWFLVCRNCQRQWGAHTREEERDCTSALATKKETPLP